MACGNKPNATIISKISFLFCLPLRTPTKMLKFFPSDQQLYKMTQFALAALIGTKAHRPIHLWIISVGWFSDKVLVVTRTSQDSFLSGQYRLPLWSSKHSDLPLLCPIGTLVILLLFAMHNAFYFQICFFNNYISSLRKKSWSYWQSHYINTEW